MDLSENVPPALIQQLRAHYVSMYLRVTREIERLNAAMKEEDMTAEGLGMRENETYTYVCMECEKGTIYSVKPIQDYPFSFCLTDECLTKQIKEHFKK